MGVRLQKQTNVDQFAQKLLSVGKGESHADHITGLILFSKFAVLHFVSLSYDTIPLRPTYNLRKRGYAAV